MKGPTGSRDTLRMVFGLLWTETGSYAKRQLTISFLSVIVTSSLSAAVPIVYKRLIDAFAGAAPLAGYLTPAALIFFYVFAQYTMRSTAELRGIFHGRGT